MGSRHMISHTDASWRDLSLVIFRLTSFPSLVGIVHELLDACLFAL
jgi:hypothetical protein